MQGRTERLARLPLVTVIAVSYNHGRYLTVCLESIRDQTYPNIQLIVIDNASTDGSGAVIESFGETLRSGGSSIDFEPILSTTNDHLTGAMIRGFAEARGSYIIFVDGDDYLLSMCVEAHVKTHLVSRVPIGATSVDMFQTRGDDLVIGTSPTFTYFVMSGQGQRKRFCRMENLEPFEFYEGPDRLQLKESELYFVERSMGDQWPWSQTTGLCFRRESVELMFSYRPKILTATDAYLVRGITLLTGSITIDRPLAVYRLHDSNVLTRHPALANFVAYDKPQVATYEIDVSLEIAECFRTQAAQLAARLEDVDSYIEAIETLSKVGPGLKPKTSASSFTMEFLLKNRDDLISAFGTTVFDGWLRRYSKRQGYLAKIIRK